MATIYTAFLPNGARIASSSMAKLRERVKLFPDTQWSVYSYDIKPNVEMLVLLVEGDISKWGTPQPIEHWKVNSGGRVAKYDPTKQILAQQAG